MPIYVYRCADRAKCGVRFERLTSFDADPPSCPSCGGATRKVPAGSSLGGQADPGLSMDRMPQTWRGTYDGNREYVGQLRRRWEDRQRLEAKYPEIAGDQRPILAHEGRFHGAPLRAGDPVLGAGGSTGHRDGHGDGHGRSGPGAPAPAAESEPSGTRASDKGSPGADSGK
ncbi:MAG TPA: zinc ribbon domain-containing protein [Pseudonocardia sp.]|jgi:putative FmdB family regulatory protein|nr:zinc ribbon domain-containing protein [Pseudonocardia sp.]